jgi:hypothetical protein
LYFTLIKRKVSFNNFGLQIIIITLIHFYTIQYNVRIFIYDHLCIDSVILTVHGEDSGGRRFEKRARAQEIYPERGSRSTPPPRKDLSAQNEYQGVSMCVCV